MSKNKTSANQLLPQEGDYPLLTILHLSILDVAGMNVMEESSLTNVLFADYVFSKTGEQLLPHMNKVDSFKNEFLKTLSVAPVASIKNLSDKVGKHIKSSFDGSFEFDNGSQKKTQE